MQPVRDDEHDLPQWQQAWFTCSSSWDPVTASFEPCMIPFLKTLPFIVVGTILFKYIWRPLRPHAPKWTRSFVEEFDDLPGERAFYKRHKVSVYVWALLCLAIIGLASQLTLSLGVNAVAWVGIIGIIVVDRPQTTPTSLLTVHSSILLSEAIILCNNFRPLHAKDLPDILQACVAVVSIVLIMNMPMRNPNLSTIKIAAISNSPTYDLRSPEDNLTLWQFMTVTWMSPLISVGSKRQLNDEDVWFLGYEFQHRGLHQNFRELQGSVVMRLLHANGVDLVLTSLLGIIEQCANFSMPVLLQQLLRSMEDPDAPRHAAMTYALLILLGRLVACQCGVFTLWFSRRCYERSRGEMITMLHEKTLSRKTLGLHAINEGEVHNDVITANGAQQQSKPFSNDHTGARALLRQWFKATYSKLAQVFSRKQSKEAKYSASMGKILNLMRYDVYEVAQRFWECNSLVTKPLGVILSVVLVWNVIGWPCLSGVLTVFIAQIINAFITRVILKWERVRRVATDKKLQITSQFVEALRHLRWFGWQNEWLDQIMDARQKELNLRIITGLWGLIVNFINSLASSLFPVMSFWAFTTLAGQALRIDILFPALQLFNMLELSLREIPGLITVLLNAYIAVGRIEDFMNEPDKVVSKISPMHSNQLELRDASFAWPGALENVLHNVYLQIPKGFTIVCGKVGSGKSALLQALLGELDQTRGDFVCPTNEVFGYCAQTPWLQSASIRENILFHSPFDESRYKDVLNACALTVDFASFKHGDLSNIGENGIGLSGGQKARVALARAIYSRAKFLILDDPVSALDNQTAEYVIRNCFKGPLLAGRATVLITHRLELCHSIADQIIEIEDGRAKVLPKDSVFERHVSLSVHAEPAEDENTERTQEEEEAAAPEKFIEDEHRASGGVKAKVYWEYIKAGKLRWWFILVVTLAAFRLISVAQTWFVKEFGEAYGPPKKSTTILSGIFEIFPAPDDNVRPWLIAYAVIVVIQSVVYLISLVFMLVIVYTAGRQMFKDVMSRVSKATFSFYDRTPVGRLMNRLTSDIGTIDGNISDQFKNVAFFLISWTTSIIVIASVTPVFLVFALAMTVAFVLIFLRFLPTSQSLRRLEMVSLSPLMSNFGALVDGLTTVRAFCAQHRFQDRAIEVTDAFQKMDHFYWTLQEWLMYRFDILSAVSTFSLTLIALFTGVSPGLTAFVLIAASRFVGATHILCRQYGQLQMDFVSVERVVELLHLEQEPNGHIMPPARWPSYLGDIVFENVTIRYAPHLDPALSSLSLTIKAGSNTAIVGRTGSGKSTLALSLLATILPESGRITIDGLDISAVDAQALRTRVTFLAQDPLLFPGTLRKNLDPLDEISDAECAAVLDRVFSASTNNPASNTDVINSSSSHPGLDFEIDTGGKNLSQGQRQLIALTRAILRKSAIVILDEATASIDLETSLRIQEIVREELRESTVVTIAHRLESVKGADCCVVMSKGGIVACGPPEEVMSQAA